MLTSLPQCSFSLKFPEIVIQNQVYAIMATPACWLLAGNRMSFVWCEMLVYVLHDKWVVYCFRIIADSTVSISEDRSEAAGIKPHDIINYERYMVSSVLLNYASK